MKIRLPRTTPVIAVAAACLLLGSTSGAVAGSLITGRQIKDGTITSVDVKNRTLKTADLSPAAVSALHGTNGARGASAWDTMPSGVTVTGRFYQLGRSAAATSSRIENVNFPAKAPSAPSGLGFGNDSFPATSTDAACTGTYSHPTAPAGHVCVYLEQASGLDSIFVNTWTDPAHQPYAFFVTFNETAANTPWAYWGSWAYTAP